MYSTASNMPAKRKHNHVDEGTREQSVHIEQPPQDTHKKQKIDDLIPVLNDLCDVAYMHKTTTLVEASDAPKNPNLFTCIGCGTDMIVKQGEQIQHHFAHKTLSTCKGESKIHMDAKNSIRDNLKHWKFHICNNRNHLPTTFANAEYGVCEDPIYEKRKVKFRPDVGVYDAHGKLIAAIEVHHTHPISHEKRQYLRDMGLVVLEVTASDVDRAAKSKSFSVLCPKEGCKACEELQRRIQEANMKFQMQRRQELEEIERKLDIQRRKQNLVTEEARKQSDIKWREQKIIREKLEQERQAERMEARHAERQRTQELKDAQDAKEKYKQECKDTMASRLWIMPNAIYQLNIEKNWVGTPPPRELGLNPKEPAPQECVIQVIIFGVKDCPWNYANFEEAIQKRKKEAKDKIAKYTLPERQLHV